MKKTGMKTIDEFKIGCAPIKESFKEGMESVVPEMEGGPTNLSHTLVGASAMQQNK